VQVLWKNAERVFCRLLQKDAEGHRHAFAPIPAGAEHPTFESISRLAREYELKEYFDGAWAFARWNWCHSACKILTPSRGVSHAGRLATMGHLAASVAHEINQPIGAARNNAHAALRFLAREPPDLAEAREVLDCVISETYRAGDIGGIREHIKKVPPRQESFELSEAIEGVIKLIRGELLSNRRA
jgi:hypothetical protein